MIQIRSPIWSKKAVGIAEHKLKEGNNLIEILYADKHGNRTYPHIYTVTKQQALECAVEYAKGVKLRIVPISELIWK